MAQPKVSAIRCIEFNVPDLEQSAGTLVPAP